MDIREVLNRDSKRFDKLNEEINLYVQKYGVKTAKSYYKHMLNEDEVQGQQVQQQGQAIDTQKMLQEFGQIGTQFQNFVQTYGNSSVAKELNDILNSMKNVANLIKQGQQPAQQQQPQQNQQAQPQQQNNVQQQPAQQPTQNNQQPAQQQ